MTPASARTADMQNDRTRPHRVHYTLFDYYPRGTNIRVCARGYMSGDAIARERLRVVRVNSTAARLNSAPVPLCNSLAQLEAVPELSRPPMGVTVHMN